MGRAFKKIDLTAIRTEKNLFGLGSKIFFEAITTEPTKNQE
jgi:hypothetical protein